MVLLKAVTKLRFLVVFVCSLFIISIFCPFLQATWLGASIPEIHRGPATFWSFKEREVSWGLWHGVVIEERWFADYWWRVGIYADPLELWIGPVLIFMLEAQVLTVLFAALAILKIKPYLLLSSTILNVLTVFCMWFVSYALNPEHYQKNLELGFLLSFSSAVLFFVVFILSRRWLQKRETIRFQTENG